MPHSVVVPTSGTRPLRAAFTARHYSVFIFRFNMEQDTIRVFLRVISLRSLYCHAAVQHNNGKNIPKRKNGLFTFQPRISIDLYINVMLPHPLFIPQNQIISNCPQYLPARLAKYVHVRCRKNCTVCSERSGASVHYVACERDSANEYNFFR